MNIGFSHLIFWFFQPQRYVVNSQWLSYPEQKIKLLLLTNINYNIFIELICDHITYLPYFLYFENVTLF
ncbi:hypothetical protein Runsl_3404 [Runella slithyformis DSM 19594]|uniref:Uncharacterized protein n=1 Tax=Runella slithyformis (strain ATCC 29530 / DSM 19594 / LMG 11500 / NCIMB 11436 / LSU 4) TaxID=761193 RepID=A0A7U3ZM71_RUNSL|nr:hypothetical protein Runsl_3404 [Runella slithyformis DSM 19594]